MTHVQAERLARRFGVHRATNYRNRSRIKARVFINLFNEQFGVSLVRSLEGLDGCLMVQSALRDAVVVGGKVLGEGAFELCG